MRVLGLDWGTVRIGAAMSDESQTLAFPLQQPLDAKKSIVEIDKLVKDFGVGKIVIGLPLTLLGETGASAKKVKQFAEKIKEKTGLLPELIDERFSTAASTKSLQTQQVKEKDQREIKDNIAAALMLQQYLEKK